MWNLEAFIRNIIYSHGCCIPLLCLCAGRAHDYTIFDLYIAGCFGTVYRGTYHSESGVTTVAIKTIKCKSLAQEVCSSLVTY